MQTVPCSQQAAVGLLSVSCRGVNNTVISGGPAAETPRTTAGMTVVRGLQDGSNRKALPFQPPPKKKPDHEELTSPQGYSKQDYSFPSSFQQKPGISRYL